MTEGCLWLFVLAAWFVVGSFGAFFFILIQLVLLVDFAHSWNESWVGNMENENSRGWYAGLWLRMFNQRPVVKNQKWPPLLKMFLCFAALLVVMTLNYIMSLTAVVLCFIFYTKPDGCFINKFFIGFNVLLCVVASVVSVHRKVQVRSLDVSASNTQNRNTKSWEAADVQEGNVLLAVSIYLYVTKQNPSEITGLFCKGGLCLKAAEHACSVGGNRRKPMQT